MRESPTAGCQAEWLLKSRSTAQTRSTGASMTAERLTRIKNKSGSEPDFLYADRPESGSDPDFRSGSTKLLLERIESSLKNALADVSCELALFLRRAVELGPPLGEGLVAIGDRRELERRDVVLHPHRAFEDRVAALVVVIREREEPLADHAAVAQAEVAHAADPVGGQVVLNARLGDERCPLGQAVEVAHLRPDAIRRRLDHARGVDLDQGFLPSRSAFAAWPRSPPCTPISRRSWSTSGA